MTQTYPLLPLRDIVVFPGMVVPLFVGRDKSVAALEAAMKSADVAGKWAASAWGKKIARQDARANLTDFERFKVAVARTKRSALVKKALAA